MTRVLAYTTPARGHLYPLVPILDELAARGHEVRVRTLAEGVPLLRTRGIAAEPIDPQLEDMPVLDYRVRGSRAKLAAAVGTFAARAPIDADDLRAAIEAEQPDVLLLDINAWGAIAEAERWGGPWAVFSPYPLVLSSRDVPPFGPGLRPARGPLGRARDAALRPLVLGAVEKAMLPALNQVRARRGLAALATYDDQLLGMPLLLSMTAEPFEYRRSDWPDSVVPIGPCAWDPPAGAPAWLAAIERPVVLVTTSSEFQDDGRLIDAALQALAGEPYDVVVTAPAGVRPSVPVPANARVEPYVPHGLLLDRAVCAVTHGGMGATQKALAHGVPVVAVPFGRDQLEVARRVEVAGAGVRLPLRRLSPQRLREAVRAATAMGPGARRVAAGFAAAGGAGAAADALEALMAPAPRPT